MGTCGDRSTSTHKTSPHLRHSSFVTGVTGVLITKSVHQHLVLIVQRGHVNSGSGSTFKVQQKYALQCAGEEIADVCVCVCEITACWAPTLKTYIHKEGQLHHFALCMGLRSLPCSDQKKKAVRIIARPASLHTYITHRIAQLYARTHMIMDLSAVYLSTAEEMGRC